MYQNYYKLNFEYSIDIIKFGLFYPVTAHEYSGFEIFFYVQLPLGQPQDLIWLSKSTS